MIPTALVSRAAQAAGVPARFVYWRGRSMRRYLFTATDHGNVADFAEAVIIAVSAGRVVWAGDAASLAALPTKESGAELFVHLLAASADERRAVIAEFHPESRAVLRLAA